MKNIYPQTGWTKYINIKVLMVILLMGFTFELPAQLLKDFTPRFPVERIRGDFTLIGNKNLTVIPYGATNNGFVNMEYVNVAPGNVAPGISILNSSTADLVFSTEGGAIPSESEIKFAGLYWTGRAHSTNSPEEFVVSGVTLNKRKVWLKGPGASTFTQIEANPTDIFFPSNQYGNMYSAFADVTNYVRSAVGGTGTYTVANIALNEDSNTNGIGYYGGWALLVVYENDAMNFRDVVVFDGHAYVAGGITADFTIPVTGFTTTQTGPVNMKLGMVAGEGDMGISGDYFEIRNHQNTQWVRLSHPENTTNNFFNSSIYSLTDGVQNPRNPNHANNYGLDISMFEINNTNNSVITNNQTSTTFRYGTTQDTYIIFCIAMAVDAYVPELFLDKKASPSTYSFEGQEITYTFKVENTGNESLSDVYVNDPQLGQTFGPVNLAPGESHTFSYVYTITAADMALTQIANTATATGTYMGETYTYTDTETIYQGACPDDFSVCIDAPAFALTGGFPAGGTYSGPGVENGNFNPSAAGSGNHLITYSYTFPGNVVFNCNFRITVGALPTVGITSENDGLINCNIESIKLTASASWDGTYNWIGPNNFEVSGDEIIISEGGLYEVIFQDNNGCSASASVTVEQDIDVPSISISGNQILTCDLTEITLTANVADGVSVLWNGEFAGTELLVSEPGLYTAVATAENGCTASASVTVEQDIEPPVVSQEPITPICIDALPLLLGQGDYSGQGVFEDNGEFYFIANEAGEYIITYSETGENGCSASTSVLIEVLQAPCIEVIVTDISCHGANDGIIQVIVDKSCVKVIEICLEYGDPALTLCAPVDKFIGGAIYTGLIPGTYYIVVTGENGCVTIQEVVINEPPMLIASVTGDDVAICHEGETTITISAQGGTPPYMGIGEFLVGVGEHTFQITDANQCVETVIVKIEALPLVELSCPDTIFIGEFAQPLVISEANPEGGIYSGTGVTYNAETNQYWFDPLLAGSGVHTITYVFEDEHGCLFTCQFAIKVVGLEDFECIADFSICQNGEPWPLNIQGFPGTFTGAGVTNNTFDPELAGLGVHPVSFHYVDAFGNTYQCEFNITVNPVPVVSLEPFGPVCSDIAPFALTGGMPEGGVYSGPGIIDGIFDPGSVELGFHTITYTYTDENGCSNSASQIIQVKTMYALYSVIDATCHGSSDGAIFVEIQNGNGEYYFQWNTGDTTQNLVNVPAGIYNVRINDGNNCVLYIANVVVNHPDSIEISATINPISHLGANDASIELTVTGGTPPYSFQWESGETTPAIFNLGPGTYTVTVTDSTGCQSMAAFIIEEGDMIIDLGITIEVDIATPDPAHVDELRFALVVTNYSNIFDATGVKVLNLLPDVFPFIARLDAGTHGTYDPETGIWDIGTIPAGDYALLVYRTGMLLNEDIPTMVNTAEILPYDQEDSFLPNNYAEVVVTIGESTGGDDGGIESDGNMASKIALRYHRRLIEGGTVEKDKRQQLMTPYRVSDVLKGQVKTAALDKSFFSGINFFIPESGPAQTKAFISTPADLLTITNANEIFAVDYLEENNKRRAAILAITTDPGSVYEHTKVICDRLIGASLKEIRHIEIAGQPFILSKLLHPGGYIDYAVSFIATWENGGFTIDNRWHNELYKPGQTGDVFNFQVWSVTPQFTKALVENILEAMSASGPLQFRNAIQAPQIPQVYVQQGKYRNGKLILELVNTNGASRIKVFGSKAAVENGERENFKMEMSIPPTPTSTVEIPVGYIFDVGFSISNNLDNTRDVLYYADGPWMFDYDPGNAVVTHFSTKPENGFYHERAYAVERSASLRGNVRSYASLFRRLGPGNLPFDLSQYNQLAFTASGIGNLEVMIAKAGIKSWDKQYRTIITLEPEAKEYLINFRDLRNADGERGFLANDVISVIFNPIGNGNQMNAFEVNVSNLHFTNRLIQTVNTGIFYPSYPNPFKEKTTLEFSLVTKSHVKIEIMNVYGQTLDILRNEYMQPGHHKVEWYPSNLNPGVYFFRIMVGEDAYSGKMIYQP